MNSSADRPPMGRPGGSATLLQRQGTHMRIIRSDAGRRLLFLGVLLILAAWAVVGAYAVSPERVPGERVAQLAQPAKTGASFQQPERKIAFEMRDKPWIGEKGSV